MADKKQEQKQPEKKKKEIKCVNNVLAWGLLAAEVIIIAVICLIMFL